MITSKLKFILVFSVIIFAFSNCEKTPENQTTVTEDKEKIDNLLDDIIAETKSLKQGCAVQHADAFLDLNYGSFLNSNWAEVIFTALRTHLNITVAQTSRFNFPNHLGTHTWNTISQVWNATAAPSDKAVLLFPSSMGQTANDVTLTTDHYTDELVTYNGYQYWFPTTMLASGVVGSEECYNVHLKSASYDNTSFQIPVEVEVDIKLSPYVFEIKASRAADPTQAHVEFIAKNNGVEKFSLVADVTYRHANYQNLDFYNDCLSGSGTFSFGKFSIPFTADFENARNLLSPSDNQINNLFDATLLYDGAEIANFNFARDLNGYTDIMINYKDGSIEDTETYYRDFLDRLEIVVLEFTGAWPN
jgi:hypothetical protein